MVMEDVPFATRDLGRFEHELEWSIIIKEKFDEGDDGLGLRWCVCGRCSDGGEKFVALGAYDGTQKPCSAIQYHTNNAGGSH